MTVFVVTLECMMYSDLKKIFATREKAEEYVDSQDGSDYYIQAVEVE
jgi:hypothetical protein